MTIHFLLYTLVCSNSSAREILAYYKIRFDTETQSFVASHFSQNSRVAGRVQQVHPKSILEQFFFQELKGCWDTDYQKIMLYGFMKNRSVSYDEIKHAKRKESGVLFFEFKIENKLRFSQYCFLCIKKRTLF